MKYEKNTTSLKSQDKDVFCLQSRKIRVKNNDIMEMGSCKGQQKEYGVWRRSSVLFHGQNCLVQ
jgi:hypothetical protein